MVAALAGRSSDGGSLPIWCDGFVLSLDASSRTELMTAPRIEVAGRLSMAPKSMRTPRGATMTGAPLAVELALGGGVADGELATVPVEGE